MQKLFNLTLFPFLFYLDSKKKKKLIKINNDVEIHSDLYNICLMSRFFKTKSIVCQLLKRITELKLWYCYLQEFKSAITNLTLQWINYMQNVLLRKKQKLQTKKTFEFYCFIYRIL